uniref:Uncharacterized protein n=1 Tax=Romanomermis culicivorax TaxID=13658 RepID=A0A915L9M9_ROMCU
MILAYAKNSNDCACLDSGSACVVASIFDSWKKDTSVDRLSKLYLSLTPPNEFIMQVTDSDRSSVCAKT